MYFKRLEMHGFKSFADPVVIEFHEGVTCVVGPNGSGKSNISDAIRWVLGEQSPKALRGGKMEEVIFAGTASRRSRGMAEVTLVIDNSAGILDIDYNEVAITRRMYRSGESEYLINNNQCRLRDIRELIMDTGIGVDGYSIIGQGKISDIVSNKPESRREIFEEAAGVVMYKSRKAEAERKLETSSVNLDRVNDIIGEIEDRIDGLREDSEKASEYLELRDRYEELEINISLRTIDSLTEKNDEYRRDIENLAASAEKLSEGKRESDESFAKLEAENGALEESERQLRDEIMALSEEIGSIENAGKLSEQRLQTIARDRERLSDEVSALKEKLQIEEKNLENIRDSYAERTKDAENAEALYTSLREKHLQLTGKAEEIRSAAAGGNDRIFSLHASLSEKEGEIKSMAGLLEGLERRRESLTADNAGAEKNLNYLREQLSEAGFAAKSAEEKISELEKEIAVSEGRKAESEKELKSLNTESSELKIELGRLISRKRTIEEMEANFEGYNMAVKTVMKSSLKGIYGTAASLMEVPEGLEIAVETAMGASMQNIVCDRDEDAKKAVNLLKSEKAGRATFLPLESVKGYDSDAALKLKDRPGFIGRASDCVTYDKKFSGIFSYLLGRAVIVKDMDSAIAMSKIAASGLRFVTLGGEVINPSGAITGGAYRNKTANILERKREIANLEKSVSDAEKSVEELASKKENLERIIARSGEEAADLRDELRQIQLQNTALQGTVRSLSDRISEAGASGDKTAREMSAIDDEIKGIEARTKTLSDEAESIRKAISETTEETEKLMSEGEALSSHIREAEREMTEARIAVNAVRSELDGSRSLLKRIEDAVADYRNQIDARETEAKDLEAERQRIVSGETTSEDVSLKREEKAAAEEKLGDIVAKRRIIAEKRAAVSGEISSFAERINSITDQKYQLELRLGKNENQIENHKNRLWDEFEKSYAEAASLRKENFAVTPAAKESRAIRNRMRELGDVNVGAIAEYRSVSERYEFLTGQREDILKARDELKSIISDMDKNIRARFKDSFDRIVAEFESTFRELFGGGHAELRMEDDSNPLESGIDIIAQPPGKKLQNINLMSGGEKTMTAIALMFAVLKTRPAPFCILDEVEAALDDANIDRFAKYLRNFDNIQFTLITHQKATMEHADVLYGVTMPERGISEVLSLRLGDDFELD